MSSLENKHQINDIIMTNDDDKHTWHAKRKPDDTH